MNIDAYLERINYHGSREPNAETLRELQLAHLKSVPFENLSIHAHEPIILADDALFAKIVEKRRGGFCYEANGLFAALLRALGFKVSMLAAEVANAAGEFGPEFDHMTLVVELEERWLVDVGFGDSFLEPLRLDERETQVQSHRAYKIVVEQAFLPVHLLWEDRQECLSYSSGDSYLTLLQREDDGPWQPQYRFTLKTHEYPDYAEMCHYHQTSPDSHFTRGRICSRATEAGRISLSEMRLITTSRNEDGEVRQERVLANPEEYAQVLREEFGVVL